LCFNTPLKLSPFVFSFCHSLSIPIPFKLLAVIIKHCAHRPASKRLHLHRRRAEITIHKQLSYHAMPTSILVASLGNPAPYTSTLHSAGHILIEALRLQLSHAPFTRDAYISPGLVSRGPQFTLYQSPNYMNTSGGAVSKAYKAFLRDLPPDERAAAQLVVLHDELEAPLGKIRMKVGGSARGHNGLKSCVEKLGGLQFVRIGVGIGRPESRQSRDVAAYVLKKVNGLERQRIEDGAADVLRVLERIAV
jgi:PTH1 family peptidyl-tRNA hydrolase